MVNNNFEHFLNLNCIMYFNTMSTFLSTVKKPTVGNGRLFTGNNHVNAG